MVVFTCQKCNSTLKRNAVEKHFSCRPLFLTCIDCLKDFSGSEYVEHRSCVTEAQKYGGSNFVLKPQGVKQANWIELSKQVIEKMSEINKYRKICHVLMDAVNIPRQRQKFHNFLKCSSPKLYQFQEVDEIFNHLEEAKNSQKEDNTDQLSSLKKDEAIAETSETVLNGESTNKKKKKKKEKSLEGNRSENVHSTDNGAVNTISQPDISENGCTVSKPPNDDVNTKVIAKEKKKRPLLETELQTSEGKYDIVKKRKKDGTKEKKRKVSEEEKQDPQNKENGDSNDYEEDNEQNKPLKDEQNCEDLSKSPEIKSDTGVEMLSKKQRKKLQKQKKFMAEIAEIENFQPEENFEEMKQEAEEKPKKKKKKNVQAEVEASTTNSVSPKHKLEGDNDGDFKQKKIKLNETLPDEEIPTDPGKKFSWGNIIKQILENTENNEMSLKKLRKKVMNEYRTQKGDDVPYEKLLGIFNKKINSTIGVKVLKDKAQLSI